MPTVLRIKGFRFHFYSDEGSEPPHIYVRSADGECKFWLTTISLARNRGTPIASNQRNRANRVRESSVSTGEIP